MKSNLFNLLSLLVILTLLLTTSGMPVTAQAKPSNHNTAPESPSDTASNIPAAGTPSNSLPSTEATQARVRQSFGQLPLYFVENQGQLDERVAYYIQGSDKTLYFTPDGVTFALTERPLRATNDEGRMTDDERPTATDHLARSAIHNPKSEIQRWAVKLDFVDANPNVRPLGQDKTEAVISYFKGSQDQWHAGLPTYASIIYPDLWPGIDLVYYGTANQLKYEFIVHPGADPNQIRLAYRGATDVTLNAAGQMQVTTPLGGFTDDTPVAYQEMGGQRVTVPMAYQTSEVSALHAPPSTLYGFSLGPYDPTRPLILDPAILVYCGYIGGSNGDIGYDIAVDNSGNAYVTGYTYSTEATFPVTGGPDQTLNGGSYDAFVAKVNATGTALVYAGYIGGISQDEGHGIAVDGVGNAYVTGRTWSEEATFPVTVGPDLTFNDYVDAFVAKVNAAGTALVYAGYIGGEGNDFGWDIAVDGAGNAYVTGDTGSEFRFPVVVGPDLTHNGNTNYGGDAFVAKVNAAGTGLVYAGYIGGSGGDGGNGIAVDSVGNAYVTGWTNSTQATFPVAVGPDLTHNGDYDAFVAKVNAAGTGLVYAGYIGGSGGDEGYGIAVDSVGNTYVTGWTDSTQATFPVTVGPDLTHNGGRDAFVAKVNAAGTALVYAGYIGGEGSDWGYDLAVDNSGNAYVTGYTGSTQATFPVTVGPDLTHNGGGSDAFVAKVSAAGTALVYAGYIGGSGGDSGNGIAVDGAGNAYVMGSTSSTQATFPVTVGPDLTYNGGQDAFVAKISPHELLVNPDLLDFGATLTQQTLSISPTHSTDAWSLSESLPWLSLSSASGIGKATVTASVNRSELSSGTYTGVINGVVSGQAVTVNVTMRVAVPQVTLVTPPAGSTVYHSDSLLVKVAVTLDGQPLVGGLVQGKIALDAIASIPFNLYDDGNHEDGAANDGLYAARITLYGSLMMPASRNPYAMTITASANGANGSASTSINMAMSSGAPTVRLKISGPSAPDYFVGQQATISATLTYPDSSIHTDTAVTVTVTRPDLKVAQVGLTNVTTDTWRGNYTFPAGQGGLYYMDARADPPAGSGFVDGWKTLTPTLYVYQGALDLSAKTSSGPWPLYSQVPLSVCVTSGGQPVSGVTIDALSILPATEQQGVQLTEAGTSGCYRYDYTVQTSGAHTVTFQARRAAYKTGAVASAFQVSSQPAVLSSAVQTFKAQTTDYMDRSLARVAEAADDGDYFKRKMQVDEVKLVVEGFVDLLSVLDPATDLAYIPSAILFPGWKVAGKEMGTLVVQELADEVMFGLLEDAVPRDVAATPMTFFATGGNPSQGLQGPILRAITDTYYVIVPMNDSLERNFSEVLARAAAVNRATFISRADETLAHLPTLTEAEQAAYIADLVARQNAGEWLGMQDMRYQTHFLNAVRDKREEDEQNYVKIVVMFVSETAIKAVALYCLDGPGLAAANVAALAWHAYLNSEAVKEDQRMRDLALATMHAGYRSQSILFTNGLSALSLIRAKTPPLTPDGAMLSVDLRRTTDVLGFWRDVYADIQVENVGPITAYFGIKAYFEKPQKRLGLDLGGETLQLVEGMTDQATGQTMPVVALAPHEVQTLRMYLKKDGEYDYGMPRTGEPIRFNLYAYTDYGAWLVHAMPGVEFRPQPATALAQVTSEADTTSGQQIAGVAPDDGTPFPLVTRVGSESGSITYTLATYASNPYPQPLAAIISQALPAQVQVLDAHGGIVTGNQIAWYVEIQPREQAVLRYDFAYAGFGVTVTLPGVNMSFYDAASSADATLTGQPTSFQAKSPLWAQATASLRVGPNTQQLVPATVSNLDTSASHQGSLILRVTDITGTQILSTTTPVSLPSADSQAYDLSYTAPVTEGLYILEVTLRQADVTQSLINDLLTVRTNRIYLPLVLRN